MDDQQREVTARKLAFLRQFLQDLAGYARLDANGRRREHYAIERLLQLLCESAADIALQRLKTLGYGLPTSYREIFLDLEQSGHMYGPRARRSLWYAQRSHAPLRYN